MPFVKAPKRGDSKRFSVVARVVYGAGNMTKSVTMDIPSRLPVKGDRLRVLRGFVVPDGKEYPRHSILEIISRTRKNPWNSMCTLGNLNVRAPDGEVTVWSNIEWMLIDKTLEYAP